MWIVGAGRALLWLALGAALGAAGLLYFGERGGRPAWVRVGRLALGGAATAAAAAAGLLQAALVGNDFAVRFVAEHSSRQTPLYLRVAAMWGGQQGSLLLWLLLLYGFAVYLLIWPPREGARLLSYALAILAAVAACTNLLLVTAASPFIALRPVPADGLGLNRLLHNSAFLLHPILLYMGFVGFTVPFAFAMAGLLRRDTGDHWIRVTHRWALTAWALLSVGILLGMHWSYHVLDWGGYWSFDPVENSALMPWLAATALIHSAMVQERRGMLKLWNAILVSLTYLLTLFGTFLARSGIVVSVHAFAVSPVGGYLLTYVGLATALAVYLVGSRLDVLQDDRGFDSLVSKEGAFLLNNVVFLALVLTVLVGTLVPVLSAALGRGITVGTPYFETVTAPLFTVVLLLAGVGPLLAWRRAGRAEFTRHLLAPLAAAALFAAVLGGFAVRPLAATIGLSCAFFAGAAVLYDFALGVAARQAMEPSGALVAAGRLVSRNPRRYGGYAVHLAMVLIACGIIASHAFHREGQFALRVGQAARVGGYSVIYEGLGATVGGGARQTYARMMVTRDGRYVTTLTPTITVGTDAATSNATYIPAVDSGPLRDLYVTFLGYQPGGSTAGFNIIVNPLVSWIWAGGALLVLGAMWSLWPRPQAVFAPRSHRIFGLWAELEYDFRMGKTAEPEYLALRAQYRREAETAMALERAEGRPRTDLERVEARIAARAMELSTARRAGSGPLAPGIDGGGSG